MMSQSIFSCFEVNKLTPPRGPLSHNLDAHKVFVARHAMTEVSRVGWLDTQKSNFISETIHKEARCVFLPLSIPFPPSATPLALLHRFYIDEGGKKGWGRGPTFGNKKKKEGVCERWRASSAVLPSPRAGARGVVTRPPSAHVTRGKQLAPPTGLRRVAT